MKKITSKSKKMKKMSSKEFKKVSNFRTNQIK